MNILDKYNDDNAMAEYGRVCAKKRAIRDHKEAIRDISVGLQNANDEQGISNLQAALNEHITSLIEAMKL